MKKKILLILSIIVLIFGLSLIKTPVRADSGWDSDYSSGGSDWGGSSSYDSDWGSSSSGGSSSGSVSDGIFVLFVIAIIIIACISIESSKNKINNIYNSNVDYTQNPNIDNIVRKYLPEFNNNKELADCLFNKFLDIQNAWMDFNYDKLKELCTDELYNSYKSDLEVLKLKNGKNIMNSFTLLNYRIDSIKEENDNIIIKMRAKVIFYDYVININNNQVIRGNKNNKVINDYELEYIVHTSRNSDIPEKCPQCGAELHSRDCEYCHSHIETNNREIVLSKKRRI